MRSEQMIGEQKYLGGICFCGNYFCLFVVVVVVVGAGRNLVF